CCLQYPIIRGTAKLFWNFILMMIYLRIIWAAFHSLQLTSIKSTKIIKFSDVGQYHFFYRRMRFFFGEDIDKTQILLRKKFFRNRYYRMMYLIFPFYNPFFKPLSFPCNLTLHPSQVQQLLSPVPTYSICIN